jgi:hypothetical protein
LHVPSVPKAIGWCQAEMMAPCWYVQTVSIDCTAAVLQSMLTAVLSSSSGILRLAGIK